MLVILPEGDDPVMYKVQLRVAGLHRRMFTAVTLEDAKRVREVILNELREAVAHEMADDYYHMANGKD